MCDNTSSRLVAGKRTITITLSRLQPLGDTRHFATNPRHPARA